MLPCSFLVKSFLWYTWKTTTFPSSPLDYFRFDYSIPFPFSCPTPILGGIRDSPCSVPPEWLPFYSVLLEDLSSFLLPGFEMFCFPITIAVSQAAQNISSPLQYSPASPSKAAWNRRSPLFEVRSSWFLNLHHRYVCGH
jgi:hypothetical protein